MTNQTPESVIAEALRHMVPSGDATMKRESQAYNIVAALRAANMLREPGVPDAATRELTEAIRLTVEYTGNDLLPAIEGWSWFDALKEHAPEVAQSFVDNPIHFPKPTDAATEGLRAERDAALAAIERVRAVHVRDEYGLCVACSWEYPDASYDAISNDVAWPCPTIAALDGAPEPEWEWGYRGETLIDVHARKSRESAEGAVKDLTEYWALHGKKFEVVRRRKAGPWLPVGGESK